MIFINYRHDDTKAVVTNLHRRLVERYGKDNVFVDYGDIPAGEKWPEYLRAKLEESDVLLAVIGSGWGAARFESGKHALRLRLDDPDDWVRQEICTAIRRGPDTILVVVLLIDNAMLPQTQWNCELDRLPELQHARIRNQDDFERDYLKLCGWLEQQVQTLKRAAERHGSQVSSLDGGLVLKAANHWLRQYVAAELRNHAVIHLPLISQAGQPVIVPIDELRIDLPLIVSHEHEPVEDRSRRRWIGSDVGAIHDEIRSTHTSAVLVDRASRHDDIPRECEINEKLGPGRRLVIVGDPGSGKSTLLAWLAYHYGSAFDSDAPPPAFRYDVGSLLRHDWLPINVLCRDLAGQPLPAQLDELLRNHLKLRQFSDPAIGRLIPQLEDLLEEGRAMLLIDGLDEIMSAEQRVQFCRLLTSIASRFPASPMVVTSRVVGFQAVHDEMAQNFDHFLVAPLDRPAKTAFIEGWSKLIGIDATRAAALVQRVCNSRVTAKLTENIFLLAMVAQIYVFDEKLPARRVDIYRRAVELMIYRRRPFSGPTLSMNELAPHLEYLAYWMRTRGVQRCFDTDAVNVFRDLRLAEPDEAVLQTRTPEDLLRASIDSVGLLNVAGTETDRRGFDRYVIQFFHQSFQEYFAGHAIKHGRDGKGTQGIVARMRDLVESIEIREREVVLRDEYSIVEPVIADRWQETVRLLIADLKHGDADDALSMLLPTIGMLPRETRARAVFALQCLADEPTVTDRTAWAVFDAAIDSMEDSDGFNSTKNTWMDEALAAVSESAFGKRLNERLIEAFIQNRAEHRNRIGCCAAPQGSGALLVTPENADALIADAIRDLGSGRQIDRVRTALELTNRFYVTKGKLGFLTQSQRAALLQALLDAFEKDEASQSAVMWALAWLTGARLRLRGNLLNETWKPKPTNEFLLLDAKTAGRIETFLQRPDLDANTLGYGCVALTRCEDYFPIIHQFDWIYELACIVDGNALRRDLPSPRPTGRLASLEWMKNLLGRLPTLYAGRIATALGALGVFVPDMVEPLRCLFTARRIANDDRDEALVYLGLIGNHAATRILVEAADTPPAGDDDYFYLRGMFGLVLVDEVDVLADQMRKALPHSDLNAYAFALAGSRDSRGAAILHELKSNPDPRIRVAAEQAIHRFPMEKV